MCKHAGNPRVPPRVLAPAGAINNEQEKTKVLMNFKGQTHKGIIAPILSLANTTGVIFDKTLSFAEHINKMCKKARYAIRFESTFLDGFQTRILQ